MFDLFDPKFRLILNPSEKRKIELKIISRDYDDKSQVIPCAVDVDTKFKEQKRYYLECVARIRIY